MRGRKPKSVQNKIAEGDAKRYGVHKLDEKLAALPKAVRGLPDAPSHLTGLAWQQWAIWKQDLELRKAVLMTRLNREGFRTKEAQRREIERVRALDGPAKAQWEAGLEAYRVG